MLTSASRHTLPRFDPEARFVTARELIWSADGKRETIPAGASFDWRARGLSQAQAAKLYRTRQIAMVLEEDAFAEEHVSDADGLRVRHQGFGHWAVVDHADEVVLGGMTKDEAIAAVETLAG